jgi:hypothetical protein
MALTNLAVGHSSEVWLCPMQIWDTTLFPRWQSLTCVVLNNCNLAVLPATVGRLSNIRELHVAGNRLAQLPRELGQLRRLQLLQADDNLLTSLPGAVAKSSRGILAVGKH